MDLFAWVQSVTADQLPTAPFRFRPCVTVLDTDRWLDLIKDDARAVLTKAKCPRGKTGALQADIERIHELTEGRFKW